MVTVVEQVDVGEQARDARARGHRGRSRVGARQQARTRSTATADLRLPAARSVWRAQVRVRAAELALELRYVDPVLAGHPSIDEVTALLADAGRIAEAPSGPRIWWSGSQVEMAWRALHVAEQHLYALQPSALVVGRIPEIAASAQAYLRPSDPVATAFGSWHEAWRKRASRGEAGPITDEDRHLLRAVVDAAHRASSTQIAKVRSFRNVLVMALLLLVAVLGGLGALAFWAPDLVPLCDQRLPGCTTTTGAFLQVMAFGAFGGAVAGVVAISHQRGTRVPYQVPLVQALLKVPAGSATALLGLVLLQSNLTPGFSAPSATTVAAYAALFGYGQQLLTTFVDRRAGEVLAPAQPRSDETGGDAA